MDQEPSDPTDEHCNTTKVPIRRRYQAAFNSEDDEEEEHIVPEPTIAVGETGASKKLLGDNKEGDNALDRFSCQVPSCVVTFATAAEYQSHYSARHMHSCSICKKNLPSSHILELHVLELHDTLFALMAEKNPMYQCFLESCQHKFSTPEDRKEHCLGEHKFSKKFHYWDCKPPRNLSVKVDTAKATGKNCTSTKGNKKQNAAQKANLQTLSNNILMEIDVASATVVQVEKLCKEGGSKSNSNGHVKASGSTMPKHIAFGRAPHRAFQNAYAAAIDPTKNKKVVTNEDDNSTLMDMKEVEDALVMSPDIDANKRN